MATGSVPGDSTATFARAYRNSWPLDRRLALQLMSAPHLPQSRLRLPTGHGDIAIRDHNGFSIEVSRGTARLRTKGEEPIKAHNVTMIQLSACRDLHLPASLQSVAMRLGMTLPASTADLASWLGIEQAYGRRPFYIVAHNPNTVPEVVTALQAGATAIEPDVNVYSKDSTQLCISHDVGSVDAPGLVDYLHDLADLAQANPQLALVVFDCKVSGAQLGAQLLDAVYSVLSPTGLNVIISVATRAMGTFFDAIAPRIAPSSSDGSLAGLRVGLMIDEETDVDGVMSFLSGKQVLHGCFGNGISVLNDILGPHVRPSLEYACALRALQETPKFAYAWTVNDADLQREYIRIGVDGLITDNIEQLYRIVQEFRGSIRHATRADNPFQPANCAYALTVYTAAQPSAGTDANIMFTVTGQRGSASVGVNASLRGRMEQNSINYVSLDCPDLGELQSVTVSRGTTAATRPVGTSIGFGSRATAIALSRWLATFFVRFRQAHRCQYRLSPQYDCPGHAPIAASQVMSTSGVPISMSPRLRPGGSTTCRRNCSKLRDKSGATIS
jgi:hypothetical protein